MENRSEIGNLNINQLDINNLKLDNNAFVLYAADSLLDNINLKGSKNKSKYQFVLEPGEYYIANIGLTNFSLGKFSTCFLMNGNCPLQMVISSNPNFLFNPR